MSASRSIVMSSPDHFEVSYTINPWMNPGAWAHDPAGASRLAHRQWQALKATFVACGMAVETVPGVPGLPDIVFPANGAVVLDGRVLLARFRHAERQGEEAVFHRFFEGLHARGLVTEIATLPEGVVQEGAGDCIWDASRQLLWAATGPRSAPESLAALRGFFGRDLVGLELVTERFYHLDTCFCVLSGGEILYFPGALSAASHAALAERVPAALRIEASAEEAASFSLNAVCIDRDVIMAPPPPRLAAILAERGYRCRPVDLSAFMLSGGASYCMSLRLDLAARDRRILAA